MGTELNWLTIGLSDGCFCQDDKSSNSLKLRDFFIGSVTLNLVVPYLRRPIGGFQLRRPAGEVRPLGFVVDSMLLGQTSPENLVSPASSHSTECFIPLSHLVLLQLAGVPSEPHLNAPYGTFSNQQLTSCRQ
jgi:hypothetical protein